MDKVGRGLAGVPREGGRPMNDGPRRAPARALVYAGAALALAPVGWWLVPVFVLNLAALSVRDLSIDLPEEAAVGPARPVSRVPWRLRFLTAVHPESRAQTEATWIAARAARLLEYRGVGSAALGCAWDVESCVTTGGRWRLSEGGHARLAAAYVRGDIDARSQFEGELIAWSCLKASSQPAHGGLAEACRARLLRQVPALGAELSPPGVVVAHYVEEWTQASGALVHAALASGALDCRGALSFLRLWIERDGFRAAELEASRSLAAGCADLPEGQFYLARAADVAGDAAEALNAYARSQPEQHAEAAFWQIDFLARQGRCEEAGGRLEEFVRRWPEASVPSRSSIAGRAACSLSAASRFYAPSSSGGRAPRVFEAESFRTRLEDGAAMAPDTLVADSQALHGRARVAERFGAVLAYGPYERLPYGRYRVSFFVKARGESLTGRIARLDVREDSDSWRPHLWSRTVRDRDLARSGYQRFDHEFTATHDGTFSIAVVTLMNDPVYFDRVELEHVDRQ